MANHEGIHLNLKASPVKNYTGGVAADDIPDEMIHRIQSFMDARLAAQTTVLFKSWRRAWRTRPDLDFRDQDFPFPWIQFQAFARTTLQRYENRNQRINSFRLEMGTVVDHHLATELIVKAIRLGATNLTLRIRRTAGHIMYILPYEVLDSETLAGLSAHDCQIILLFGRKEVSWSNLKTLNLSHAFIYGDLFYDLISKCTSLEKIALDRNVSFPALFRAPRRLSPSCESKIKLLKLKSLQLIGLDRRDYIYRHELWPKFPCLKELEIRDVDSNNYDWTGLRICSPSLELITIYTYHNKIRNGAFDVPNIRKFKLVGNYLPQLDEFETSSSNREWKSDIHVQCYTFTASWFSSLSKLLIMLSPSRISLSVRMDSKYFPRKSVYSGDGGLPTRVENLSITGFYELCFSRFSAFLEALLQSCRPNCISVDTRFTGNVNLEALFQRLGYRPCETHDSSGDQQYLIKFQRI
ncbi:hypothetical protein SASPL_152989 [Salvia splendens]|uniref:Uncharacterized protein n=1 Tax=Salvia splendens TaxID=180675 RepID=A0A8X8W408_SALSN|nr:putative F-box/FBD/LRR-repeat protein At3g56780 isoform X1 [Salvia splendens]KAG6387795.1 hypothetical protein SASPL_152989 [Salvia splendens]